MGWIDTSFNYKDKTRSLIIKPYKTDLGFFKIVKLRFKQTCCICGKPLYPKTYCYGNGWNRLCLNCGYEFTEKGIKAFKDIIKDIKKTKKQHEKNKDNWEAENTLANL